MKKLAILVLFVLLLIGGVSAQAQDLTIDWFDVTQDGLDLNVKFYYFEDHSGLLGEANFKYDCTEKTFWLDEIVDVTPGGYLDLTEDQIIDKISYMSDEFVILLNGNLDLTLVFPEGLPQEFNTTEKDELFVYGGTTCFQVFLPLVVK